MIQTDNKKKRTQIPKAFHFPLNAFVVVTGGTVSYPRQNQAEIKLPGFILKSEMIHFI